MPTAFCLPVIGWHVLIGSSSNLLSWMRCAGIGSSRQREHGQQQQTGRETEREEARGCPAQYLERRGGRRKRGVSRLLCPYVLLHPPSPPDSRSLSFPLLICFCGCAERKGTCRSLMIQPFSSELTDKTACPSCHCSAWPSCPLHYSYCSCSWPSTSTPPLLPKCSGEWALLFHHCSLLDCTGLFGHLLFFPSS